MIRRSGDLCGRVSGVLVLLAVFAQLALASAVFWHHHDDRDADHADHADHADCVVCVAVASPTIHGDPTAKIALPPHSCTGVLVPACAADRSVAQVWAPRARGPPAE